MPQESPIQDAIMSLLEQGPMAVRDLAEELGKTNSSVSAKLTTMRQRGKPIRILRYERQPDGVQGRLIPVYELGTEPDAPMPKLAPLKKRMRNYQRKYRERHEGRVYLKERAGKGREINPFTLMVRSLTT